MTWNWKNLPKLEVHFTLRVLFQTTVWKGLKYSWSEWHLETKQFVGDYKYTIVYGDKETSLN